MKLKLSEFFIYLIQKKSFYGRLASSLERVARPGMGTLAVGIREGRAVLFYDPEFIGALPFKSASFALEHELLHLMLDHIPRYLELLALCPTELDRAKAAKVFNIAMDCAINTMLRKHEGFDEIEQFMKDRIKAQYPDAEDSPRNGMCLPEKWDLPLEGSFEFYQWSLMRKVKVIDLSKLLGGTDHSMWTDGEKGEENPEQTCPGDGQGDGQGNDGKGDQDPKGMVFGGSTFKDMTSDELLSQAHRIREQLKQTMRSVVRSMGGIGRGTLPGGLEEWLEAYLADPIVPWWEIFSTRAKMSRTSKHRRSVAQPNRMLLALAEEDVCIIPTPGRVRDKAWRVFLYVDTSGSMSSESLEIVKSELQHMLAVDENMEIRYMQGDAATHMDVVLHSGDEIPKEVVGRGGTDFDAYFIHMSQYVKDDAKSPDIVVVYTDGYAPSVDKKNRLPQEIPVLWLVTPHHSEHFHEGYGEIIVCDPSHNDRYKG
jgi:predicted metal-dependent peptidase